MFSAVLLMPTVSALGDAIEGTEMRSRCRASACGGMGVLCRPLAAGTEGCPAPASSPVWGLVGPNFAQVTSMGLLFLLQYLG